MHLTDRSVPIYLSIYLLTYLPVYLQVSTVYQPIYLSIYLPVYLSSLPCKYHNLTTLAGGPSLQSGDPPGPMEDANLMIDGLEFRVEFRDWLTGSFTRILICKPDIGTRMRMQPIAIHSCKSRLTLLPGPLYTSERPQSKDKCCDNMSPGLVVGVEIAELWRETYFRTCLSHG